MTNPATPARADVEVPEVVDPRARQRDEFIEQPAKVMRVGTMMKQLLEEVRATPLDEPSRERLREIYETSLHELGSAISPDLRDELARLSLPFAESGGTPPTTAELQIAQAQLVGWLEGLIQGIQATLFAQQMAAQQQLANMRGQIGPGGGGPGRPGEGPHDAGDGRPGTYL
ncbi:MAG: proteasome activator [Acidimicrobiales bacterium]